MSNNSTFFYRDTSLEKKTEKKIVRHFNEFIRSLPGCQVDAEEFLEEIIVEVPKLAEKTKVN